MIANSRIRNAINAMDEINRTARTARLLCNDIIRQTSLKPYYGKRGGAAMYAGEDGSAEQLKAINDAVEHLHAATQLLVDIAVNGGTTAAMIHEITKDDYGRYGGYVAHPDDEPVDAQRSVSYGELVELENMFNNQAKERGITFNDDDKRSEALLDFQQQYIDGNDSPEIHIY